MLRNCVHICHVTLDNALPKTYVYVYIMKEYPTCPNKIMLQYQMNIRGLP